MVSGWSDSSTHRDSGCRDLGEVQAGHSCFGAMEAHPILPLAGRQAMPVPAGSTLPFVRFVFLIASPCLCEAPRSCGMSDIKYFSYSQCRGSACAQSGQLSGNRQVERPCEVQGCVCWLFKTSRVPCHQSRAPITSWQWSSANTVSYAVVSRIIVHDLLSVLYQRHQMLVPSLLSNPHNSINTFFNKEIKCIRRHVISSCPFQYLFRQ